MFKRLFFFFLCSLVFWFVCFFNINCGVCSMVMEYSNADFVLRFGSIRGS